MFRLGIISELGDGENLGFARVSFDDSELVSAWLPLPSTNTKTTKQWIPVEVNSQVACLMDDMCEQGCIVMVLWSETDTPPDWATADTIGIVFADGAEMYYDAKEHTLIVNAPDAELTFKCKKMSIEGEVSIKGDTSIEGDTSIKGDTSIEGETKINGDTSVTGEVSASVEVKAGPLGIALTTHKHPSPAGPTGPPTP